MFIWVCYKTLIKQQVAPLADFKSVIGPVADEIQQFLGNTLGVFKLI